MASSISSSHLHRDRRHPRHRLAYVAAVAIVGLAAETVLLHDSTLPPPWLLCRRVPCSPVRRCLCCRPAELCSAGSPRRLRCRCIAVGSSCLSRVIGGVPSLVSLSPGVSSKLPCRDVAPSAPLPPPLNGTAHAARSRLVPGARCVCLIVVGALAPLCFLFSVFQHARPPATPRRLGPPLTERRSKTLGLAHKKLYCVPTTSASSLYAHIKIGFVPATLLRHRAVVFT